MIISGSCVYYITYLLCNTKWAYKLFLPKLLNGLQQFRYKKLIKGNVSAWILNLVNQDQEMLYKTPKILLRISYETGQNSGNIGGFEYC